MSARGLTGLELDLATVGGCMCPRCEQKTDGKLFLKSKCHPGSGVELVYQRFSNALTVQCRSCGAHVLNIAVVALPNELS